MWRVLMPVTVYNSTDVLFALAPILRTANTTVAGVTIDRTDTNGSVEFAVIAGAVADGTSTFTIQESDDNSSWANAAAGDIQGAPLVIATADANTVKELGYAGRKRYVRASVTSTGFTTGGLFGAVAVMTGGRKPNVR